MLSDRNIAPFIARAFVNRLSRTLLSLVLATALLWALWQFGGLEISDLRETWERLTWQAFLIAVLLHGLVYLVRAWRYQVLLGGEVPYMAVLTSASAHNLASTVLPARSGDATLVVYLKAHAGVQASRGLAVLVIARLLDLSALCAGLTIACFALAGAGREGPWMILALVALPGTLLLVGLAIFGHRIVGALASRLSAAGHGWRRWVGERMERVAEAAREAGRGPRVRRGALLTGVVWIGIFGFYGHLARSMGTLPGLGFAEGVFGSGLAIATNLLPVNFLAGFGTHEAGWVLGYGMLGAPEDLALATGLGAHLVALFDVALFGAIAHIRLGWNRK